jgi:hypothetical protein
MSEDIIEIKPGLPGIKLNVRALIRRLTTRAKSEPVAAVAQRFLSLFQEHGVPATQIPRLVPQLTLDRLRSTETLLPALTGAVLDHTANLFRVRRTWIEGASDTIYECPFCYQKPEWFFEEVAATSITGIVYPIRALFSGKGLDMTDAREQPIALLLLEKVAELGDEEIVRYRIFCDEWDWGHWKCRVQLKAMARLVDKELSLRIPLYRTDKQTIEDIRSGKRVPPASVMRRSLGNLSLEDFALGADESKCSKELAELPFVLDYIKNNDLEKLAHAALRSLKKS